VSGRVLVAGIGNVFLGDDGFGVEVVHRLVGGWGEAPALPDGVDVVDYGIRGVHLAYELLDERYDTVVLVDAVPMAEPPGTLAVLEVGDDALPAEAAVVEAHAMNPAVVLTALRALGGRQPRVLVVGCAPGRFDEDMQLSAPVAGAVDEAVRLVARVAGEAAGARQEGRV
jgi:hydrogenase maturation protease